MRTLKEAIAESSWTQAELADLLGVSRVSLSKWVNGHEPVPRSRDAELRRFVGDFLVEVTDEDRLVKPDPHVTFFGWYLDKFGGHLGTPWKDRVETLAKAGNVEPHEVQAWAEGRRLIPLSQVPTLKRAWPGMNLLPFQFEMGEDLDEAYAVRLALNEVEAGRPGTFARAIDELRDIELRFKKDPTIRNEQAVKLALWRESDGDEQAGMLDLARRFKEQRDNDH